MRLAQRIAILITTLLISLFAPVAKADTTSGLNNVTDNVAPLRGTLYRIDYQDHSAWLFGTIHVGQTAFYPLEPQVTKALQQADTLVIEVDIRNTNALQKALRDYAFYRDGSDLSKHLSHDALQALKNGLREAGIPYDAVATMKPWMVANIMIIHSMAQSGYPAEQGIEQYLLSVAEKENKTVRELETANSQLSLFDKMSKAQQEEYLLDTLEDLRTGIGIKKGIDLIQAWSRADSLALENQKREMLADGSISSRFIEDALLNGRNPGMTTGIEALLKDKQKIFVAVGTWHLVGDNSIPALLKQRGYRVTKLY